MPLVAAAAVVTPQPVGVHVVDLKATWSKKWKLAPDIELVSAKRSTASAGTDTCTLRGRYGRVKRMFNPDFQEASSVNLTDYWVRIRLVEASGINLIWTGRIASEVRTLYTRVTQQAGVQHWTAFGPLDMLRKINVGSSRWLDGGIEKTIDWVPSMNHRDRRRMIRGNRTTATLNGRYIYGETALWTRRNYVEYVLATFAGGDGVSAPKWWLTGQADVLDRLSDFIDFGKTTTVLEILRKLISPRIGLDFKVIEHTEGSAHGFAVHVFALQPDEVSFGGETLPKNPDRVDIKLVDRRHIESANIERSTAHRYGRIRVLGNRILVVATLDAVEGSLTPKWTTALEARYKAGTGNASDKASDHDRARQDDELRPVYASFGAPLNWDHVNGLAAPVVDSSGMLHVPDLSAGEQRVYQNSVRTTESWLPLRDGVRYDQISVDQNPPGHEPDFLPPTVWVFDEELGRYRLADEVGISVSVSKTDWGVFLSVSPSHLLALNHFELAEPTETEPLYDYAKLIATIAFRGDHRLALTYELPGGSTPSDGCIDIDVDAEFWYLTFGTVVSAIPPEIGLSGLLRRSDPSNQVLRNDADLMRLTMAGAIARYYNERDHASITIRGLLPWAPLIGQVLSVIEASGDAHDIRAVITDIAWNVSDDGRSTPTTTLHTGYAT